MQTLRSTDVVKKYSNAYCRIRMPLGDVPRYFEQKVAKRREWFAISTDSPGLIPRVSKFTSRLAISSHWGIIARALRSQPSQNSPHRHAFSPLLRSEGRNIEMEASSGRVWLQIFRNNRIGLCAMVPQVLLRYDSHPFALQS